MQSCPLLHNRWYLNSGRSHPKLLPMYCIAKSYLFLHPNTYCPFQKPLVTVQPAVRLIATVPIYRIHTFTSGFFPLNWMYFFLPNYANIILPPKAIFYMKSHFLLSVCIAQLGFCEHVRRGWASLCCCIIRFQVRYSIRNSCVLALLESCNPFFRCSQP